MSKEVLRQARRAASAVKQFAKRNPSQILCLHESKKRYPRIEAWQLLAACFGCNALITATQELRDDAGTEIGFLAIAHVKNPSNQFVSGAEAVCMRAEEEWAHKPAFQLRSMAQTRAEGKAFRLQFGWVMVMAGFEATPAEEVEFGKAFDQIESTAEPIRATPKLVTERQVNAFQEACAVNGKTLEDARNYLQSQFGVDDVTRLKRGKQCTEALRWAQTPNHSRRPTQPALTLLDSIPAHKDAWGLCEAFAAIANLGLALGMKNLKDRPGLWEYQVDEHWWFALNPHKEPLQCSREHGPTVKFGNAYIEFNGWPAGMISPAGGIIAAGALANERTFIDAVNAARQKTEAVTA